MTALHYACKYGHHEIVQLLTEHNANVAIQDFVSLKILYKKSFHNRHKFYAWLIWVHLDMYLYWFGVGKIIEHKANVAIQDFVSLEILYKNPSSIFLYIMHGWLSTCRHVLYWFGGEKNSVHGTDFILSFISFYLLNNILEIFHVLNIFNIMHIENCIMLVKLLHDFLMGTTSSAWTNAWKDALNLWHKRPSWR